MQLILFWIWASPSFIMHWFRVQSIVDSLIIISSVKTHCIRSHIHICVWAAFFSLCLVAILSRKKRTCMNNFCFWNNKKRKSLNKIDSTAKFFQYLLLQKACTADFFFSHRPLALKFINYFFFLENWARPERWPPFCFLIHTYFIIVYIFCPSISHSLSHLIFSLSRSV